MSRFKVKPRGAPRRTLTAAQEAQSRRAFRLFQLRGLYALAGMLTPNRRRLVQILIDQEIESLGAVPQARREAEQRATWDREYQLGQATPEFDEIPF